MAECRRESKLGPLYETGPVSFSESFVRAEIPNFITEGSDGSDYRTLTWILIKVSTVKFVRSEINARDQWPPAEEIMEKRAAILQILEDISKNREAVNGYLNQFRKTSAFIALLASVYDKFAYEAWIKANNGLNAEFDRAIYHFTGWEICKAI